MIDGRDETGLTLTSKTMNTLKRPTVKSHMVGVALTPQEKEFYSTLARRGNVSLAQLIRHALRETYQNVSDKDIFGDDSLNIEEPKAKEDFHRDVWDYISRTER